MRLLPPGKIWSRKEGRVVIKNLLTMVLAAPIGSAANFFMTILIARTLRAQSFGIYSQIIGFVSVLQVIIETSRATLVRQINQAPGRTVEVFRVAQTVLWVVSVACLLVLVGAGPWAVRGPGVSARTLLLAGLGAMALFHALGYGVIFVATERMEYNALGSAVHKLFTLFLVYEALTVTPSLNAVFLMLAIGNWCLWVFYSIIFRNKYGSAGICLDISKAWTMIKEVVIVGWIAVVRRVSFNVAILMLPLMAGASETGIFNGAYNMVFSANMIPWIATLAIFPLFTRMAQTHRAKLLIFIRRTIIVFYLLGIPAFAVAYSTAQYWTELILGAHYAGSVAIMRVLVWDLLFSLPVSFLFYVFSALGRDRAYLIAAAGGLTVSIIGNAALIPGYGALGAAAATLCGDAATLLGILWALWQESRTAEHREALAIAG